MSSILKLFAIIVLLVMTVMFNFGLIDIRMDEIRYLLGTIAQQQDVSNTFGIVAKYDLIKRRMLYGEENISNYELEAKIQALTSNDQLGEKENSSWTNRISKVPVRVVVNSIRFMLGKKIINPIEDNKILSVLEIAYFWERNRKYLEAQKIYDNVIETPNVGNEIKAATLVHKAFCFSMMSEYGKAKGLYETVISRYPETEAGVLSWKLLDFIQSMERERDALSKVQISEFEKAKQYYTFMNFRDAVRSFSIFLGHNKDPEMIAESRFYKGRSHEEIGETDEAIAEYKEVIRIDKTKNWARQANRRLLMLGTFYEQQKQIADEARRQLEAYQDQVFISNVNKYSKMVQESSLKSDLLKGNMPVRTRTDDSLLNLITTIGDLDLSGEKAIKDQQASVERAQRELLQQGKLSAAEIKELERRQSLATNPYRRPSVLKKFIDENAGELKYIYNKRLRKGYTLSGKMLVGIKIGSNGAVKETHVIQSNVGDPEFEQEIVQRINKWQFGVVPDSLGDLLVNYPFEFYEEK